ncbi:MAG: ATP-dependent sacrificial sulfur transferase LarE, partial [Promethearchaeota archaeon]
QVLYPSKKYLARIEVDDSFIQIYFKDPKSRQKIVDKFKRLGFTFTTLDLQGFVSGSLHKAV